VELSLTFNDNSTLHDDILFRFAGQEWICDSYYFAIDGALLPEVDDETKIRAVLRRLLEQWLETIHILKIHEVAYLPYDFSDQYTGWLRCTRTQSGFVVVRGWSSVEGWSLFASAVGALLFQLSDFRVDGPSLEIGTSELAAAIRESMSLVA
jgi:hypothetical protein